MPRPHRIDIPGFPRHIGIRGVNGMACFTSDKDRNVFLKYLREALGKGDCALNAFVLMSNHVHLLATPTQAGAVSAMMHALVARYARYFNAAHERTGPLFEGRYWASLIETETYLFETMRYIELNPVRACLVDSPGQYPWSSFLHNTGVAMREELTFHDAYRALGPTPAASATAWAAFVDEGIAPDNLARLRKHFRHNRPLGSTKFLEQIKAAET